MLDVRYLCSLFVKECIVGLSILSCGSLFQSRMVRGKKECLKESVLLWYVSYFCVCELRVFLALEGCRYSCLAR